MAACFDHDHPLVPVNPDRLTGPEAGSLMRYRSRSHPDRVVRVVERSYVWAPEQHNPNGTHGQRRYGDSVIEYTPSGARIVVLDTDLSPIEPGDVLAEKETAS